MSTPILAGICAIPILLLLAVAIAYKRLKDGCDGRIEEAQRKADEAAKAKDLFLANISHETRTPMNAIIGLSHILLQSELNDEQKTNLFKIKRSAEHLLSITNDILDYSKLEAGKLTLENIQIESSDFFSNLSDIIAPMAVEKNLDLVFDISPDLPESWEGDPLRISQILLNLLNNAVKFTQKGYVLLKAEYTPESDESGTLLFEVTDTGIGLTDDQIKVLFEAFSQADNSISRKFGGTGLGLTISSELAEMMGSRLEVHSRYKEGSTFSFALPLKHVRKEEKKRDRLLTRLLEQKTVLIVEKSDLNAKILAKIYSHYHARPKIAADKKELLRLLEWEHYDAICLDSRLIDSTLDKHRLKEHCKALIVLQYDILPGTAVKNLQPDAVLPKPFTPLNVQSKMVDLFGKNIVEKTINKKHVTFDDILVLKGSRILLAEDNEGNVMVIEGLLEGSGIELVTAGNGQKAIETLFNDKPFDMVLMDINMPVMDGYAATSIIREYPKYDNVPIIAMTANITESDMNKSKSAGMQDFVGKPVDVEQFYTTLLKYIEPKVKATDVRPAVQEEPAVQEITQEGVIPGLDFEEGLARINGNRKAYENILKKYTELFADIVPKLKAAAQSNQHEEGRQLAHNLKGLSGNIAATDVYKLAAEVESAFKGQGGEPLALIAALEKKLDPLLQGIRSYLAKQNASAEPAAPLKPITPAALSGIVESLVASAHKKKALEIKQACKSLKEYMLPTQLQADFDALFAAADAYQYDKVGQLAGKILKGL